MSKRMNTIKINSDNFYCAKCNHRLYLSNSGLSRFCPKCGEPLLEGLVRSNQTGRWISRAKRLFLAEDYDCSCCGGLSRVSTSEFCEDCGAKMGAYKRIKEKRG